MRLYRLYAYVERGLAPSSEPDGYFGGHDACPGMDPQVRAPG